MSPSADKESPSADNETSPTATTEKDVTLKEGSVKEVAAKDVHGGAGASHSGKFTRADMERVLMERNNYKEQLLELREAIRWSEWLRATRSEGTRFQARPTSTFWEKYSLCDTLIIY